MRTKQYESLIQSDLEPLKRLIRLHLQAYHRGSNRRIDRWELVELVSGQEIPPAKRTNNNPHDRRVRLAIAEMRKEGDPICSDSSGGYWWAASPEEIEGLVAELESRARDLLETANRMRRRSLEIFGAQSRLL